MGTDLSEGRTVLGSIGRQAGDGAEIQVSSKKPHLSSTLIVNYQDFPIFSSNFKILEILKFFHQFIKENHQFIKFIKFHKIFFLELVPKKE